MFALRVYAAPCLNYGKTVVFQNSRREISVHVIMCVAACYRDKLLLSNEPFRDREALNSFGSSNNCVITEKRQKEREKIDKNTGVKDED